MALKNRFKNLVIEIQLLQEIWANAHKMHESL